MRERVGRVGVAVIVAATLVASALAGCVGRADRLYTVSEAIAARDAGELGAQPITLTGYWTDRAIGHSCAFPGTSVGELEIYCYDGEFGITQDDVAILEWTAASELIPTTSPFLTPFVSQEHWQRLELPMLGDEIFFPPVPITVIGHFGDPRAADCRPEARQKCLDRLVIDRILAFDPASVPPPTPQPEPTPFPDPPPPAAFGPAACAGDVEYSFVGWTTTAELGTDAQREGHVFAMVTKEAVPIGDWFDDDLEGPLQPSRWWGRQICYTTDVDAAAFPEGPPMLFEHIDGTTFREWQDGRREPGSPD